MTLRQVYFATLDLTLHSRYQAGRGGSVFASPIVKQVIDENTVVPPLLEDRFLNAFQHIFAGGYSAGEVPRNCVFYWNGMKLALTASLSKLLSVICRVLLVQVGGSSVRGCL